MKDLQRIAFWILTLSLCLLAKPLPIIDMDDSNIGLMREQVECPSDLTLYTPSNVKEQCITAALNCFVTELRGTAKDECEDPQKRINPAVKFLELLTEERSGNVSIAPKNSDGCVCESWPPTPFSHFLEDMESFLQSQNAAAS
ncbi:uncharacterized protein il2 [Brachionichthys hirsutus]|uniref:uncharacterized protein il2 n=1 Tax=Brachionichthys hirsutus TaxID=412623 RepID=UPI003604BB0B